MHDPEHSAVNIHSNNLLEPAATEPCVSRVLPYRLDQSTQTQPNPPDKPNAPIPDKSTISSLWRGTILDSIADGLFTVDESWTITSFNRAAERITGFERHEAIGKPCYEVFRTTTCRSDCALKRTFDSGASMVNVSVQACTKDGRRLPLTVSTALLRAPDGTRVGGVETFRDMTAIEQPDAAKPHELANIVGRHPSILRIVEVLPEIAHSDAPVLVRGPGGSGKKLVARTIHEISARRDRPFVSVCCSALPEPLLELELFGGVDVAGRAHAGRVRQAEGGTLILDDVEAISPSLQYRLLGLLEHRRIETKKGESVDADVRIVACAGDGFTDRVQAGKFRQDLYGALNIVDLCLPPLEQRPQDIPLLVERFITQQRMRTGRDIRGMTHEAMSQLVSHHYPGNVRELKNAVEHGFVLCSGEHIDVAHLPSSITQRRGRFAVGANKAITNPRQAAEAEVIRQTLERNGGNRLAAARELGMHRTTLWRKLKFYGIAEQAESFDSACA